MLKLYFLQTLMKKKTLFIIPFFLLLIILVAGITFFKNSNRYQQEEVAEEIVVKETAPITLKAKVIYLTGDAWQLVEGRKTELKENDTLDEGAEIITEKEAKVVLNFDDGSVLRIGEDTTLVLNKLNPNEMIIDDKNGVIFARVNKDENHKFIVKAGEITVEALGTIFSVENNEENVEVKVIENKVTVVKEEETTEVSENKKWTANKDKVEDLSNKELTDNSFLAWSLEEENLTPPTPTATTAPTKAPVTTPTDKPKNESKEESSSGSVNSISLNGSKDGDKAKLNWSVDGDSPKGFKVVWSKNSEPTYPTRDGDKYHDYDDSGRRTDEVGGLEAGQTYHFRVCEYLGGKCGKYSNEITIGM